MKNSIRLNYLPVLAAVVAAAVVSAVWYNPLVFGKQWIALRAMNSTIVRDAPVAPWKVPVEIVREFVVAYVLLRFVKQTRTDTWTQALSLGFWVWMGFPVAMLVGASLWDGKPWELTFIHGGDWLTKMLVMSVVITWTRGMGKGEGRAVRALRE